MNAPKTRPDGPSLALLGAAAATGLTAALLYGVHGRGSQLFAPSVRRGPGRRRSIALTFDDGPSPGTAQLAAYLAQENVPATFFQCGENVLRHPGITRDLHQAGHQIGNHTFSHRRLCPRLGWQLNLLSADTIYRELAQTQEVIALHTGTLPQLFRAPYGMRWFGLRAAQRRLGLLGVMWTAIGYDWEWQKDRVVAHLLRHISPGGILCLHDGRDTRTNPDISVTLAAVKELIPHLKDRGYRFETVEDLLRPD